MTAPTRASGPAQPSGTAGAGRLARLAGRGAIVNVIFGIVIQLLATVQGVIVPRLLGPENIGLFALAMGGVTIGMTLKELGIPEKLVQERDVDLHTSYAVAFTLEMLLAGTFFFICLGVAPLLAWIYHRPELWILTAVLSFTIFTTAFLDLPAALPYREMRFVRRNMLTSIGPVATFCVTIPTAFMGWGVWSLVAGALAGFGAAAIALAVAGPMRPRFSWDGPLARRYLTFGWPLWIGGLAGLIGGWGAIFVVSSAIGVAGLGYFQLAQNLAARALQVDGMLSDALFPALCAIQGSTARLRRAFVISNQLSMLWAAPVGLALFLFASPAVHLLLGPKWAPAILLMQAEGAAVVVTAMGYNWRVFYTAQGDNKPQLVVSAVSLVWLGAVVFPLLELYGIRGAAGSLIVLAVATYAVRSIYLRRLLGPISLLAIAWREVAGALIAAAVIGLLRLAGWEVHDLLGLVAQGTAYLVVCGLAALVLSGGLLRETIGALRGRGFGGGDPDGGEPGPPPTGAPATPAAPAAEDLSIVASHTVPHTMAFPLAVAADEAGRAVWATTRDWPAMGRLDLDTGEWRWLSLPPFPHVPTPDGAGGCWTALTRASAVVHVTADLEFTTVPVPRSRELLVTALHDGALWVVDGRDRRLFRVDEDTHSVDEIRLPDGFRRPDYIAAAPDGRLWIGDTHAAILGMLDTRTLAVETAPAPFPTRAVVADLDGRGMWLGSSNEATAALVATDGEVLAALTLPDIPFGLHPLADGRIAAAHQHLDAMSVTDPVRGTVEVIPLPATSRPMGCTQVDGGRCVVALSGMSELVEVELPPARARYEPTTAR